MKTSSTNKDSFWPKWLLIAGAVAATVVGLRKGMGTLQTNLVFKPHVCDYEQWRLDARRFGLTVLSPFEALVQEPYLRQFKIRPEEASGYQPTLATIVFFHGRNGTALEKVKIAKMLSRLGYRVVLVEYPGFGPLGELKKHLHERGLIAWSAAIVNQITETFPDDPLWVFGESMGSGIATHLAHLNLFPIERVILSVPYANLKRLSVQKAKNLPIGWILRTHFENEKKVLGKFPALYVLGVKGDTVTPYEDAVSLVKLSQQSGNEAYGYWVEGVSHGQWYQHLTLEEWSCFLNRGDCKIVKKMAGWSGSGAMSTKEIQKATIPPEDNTEDCNASNQII